MKQMLINAMAVTAVAVLSGCATVYRVSESAPTPIPPPAPGGPATRNPTVVVKSTAADSKSASLASALAGRSEGDLAGRGFDVIAKGRPDSVVSLSVSRREAARLSDWRVYDGAVDAKVLAGGKLVANQAFKARGERASDEEVAEASVAERLSRDISTWLAKVLPAKKVALPPGELPPALATATVMIRPSSMSEKPSDVLRVQRRFMDAVASHPGILSCTLDRENQKRREFAFRVVFEPQSFPGGLLNTIVLSEPDLGEDVRLEIVR